MKREMEPFLVLNRTISSKSDTKEVLCTLMTTVIEVSFTQHNLSYSKYAINMI